jgi:gliding motility-associated-like protein
LGKQVSFLNESNNAVGAIVNSEWLVGNGVVSNNNTGFDYTFNQGGNYLVSLKVATANGCSTTLTKTIVVEPAIANAGKDTIVREGEPFVLNGTGGITYVWQPPIGLDDVNKANPIGILNNSQQYNVKITTAQGCVGFDTVMITVLRNLKIPNAFSPNGDGVNETWNIEQLKDYPTAEIQIFNRNGQLLYNAKGNNINAWNGTINNKPVPVGTYYYVITLNNQLRNKPFTGWVLVVR